MGTYFAYARVSTPRQGEKGVSLTEQREAIERYAKIHGLEIARWFEERESASHQGRPAFAEMLRLLKRRMVQGVIIHKIDRSARNLEDWADMGQLVDVGVEVHFATENLDLRTVAGRLSADIQAVVAAHYSRNLREEVKKGLYGRLKQGFYPFTAPIGYLDQGSAKLKSPDPKSAHLIRLAFQLYRTGEYSLPQLAQELYRRGLRNRTGTRVTVNGIATILRNPFYVGLMRIRKTGNTYPGNHEPLVSVDIFRDVQEVLEGKRVNRINRRLLVFSRLVRCRTCGYSLIGEIRKGHIYYRCHNRPFKNPAVCPPTSVREESLEAAVLNAFAAIELTDNDVMLVDAHLKAKRAALTQDATALAQSFRLQLDQIETRLARLTDLLVDGTVQKELFSEKQNALLLERARARETLAEAQFSMDRNLESVEKIVELAKRPSMLYKSASLEKKRELVKTILSDVKVSGKNVEITLSVPFRIIADRQNITSGGPQRGACRTWEEKITELQDHYTSNHNASDMDLKRE